MNYLAWIWHNTAGIRLKMLIRILAGTVRVAHTNGIGKN